MTELDEMVGERSALVAGPGGEGREQSPLVDQAVLQRQEAEQQVTRRIASLGHSRNSHSIKAEQPPLPPGHAGPKRL